jgi:hypothetical protein
MPPGLKSTMLLSSSRGIMLLLDKNIFAIGSASIRWKNLGDGMHWQPNFITFMNSEYLMIL